MKRNALEMVISQKERWRNGIRERNEIEAMRHVEENEAGREIVGGFLLSPAGRGEGKRQSYEKPGFIGYEGNISWRCSAADRRLFRSSLARYREEEAAAYLGSWYTLSLRIMVVKRFASSIFVARNATLIVNSRGIVQSPPTPFCRT